MPKSLWEPRSTSEHSRDFHSRYNVDDATLCGFLNYKEGKLLELLAQDTAFFSEYLHPRLVESRDMELVAGEVCVCVHV